MAFSTRFDSATRSWCRSPMTRSPSSPAIEKLIRRAWQASLARPAAVWTISSMSTGAASPSGSSDCRRPSSMICWTSSPRRVLSTSMRPAKWRTASGSSAASWTVSASTWRAPTGVLSSWEMLATRSRLDSSTRMRALRSSPTTRTASRARGRMRTWSWREGASSAAPSITSRSAPSPVRRAARTASSTSAMPMRVPRTSPMVRAGAFA